MSKIKISKKSQKPQTIEVVEVEKEIIQISLDLALANFKKSYPLHNVCFSDKEAIKKYMLKRKPLLVASEEEWFELLSKF